MDRHRHAGKGLHAFSVLGSLISRPAKSKDTQGKAFRDMLFTLVSRGGITTGGDPKGTGTERSEEHRTQTQTQREAKTGSEHQESDKGKTTPVTRLLKARRSTQKKTHDSGSKKNTPVNFSAPQRDSGGGRPKGVPFP